jgi:hypothetical protein
LHKTFVAMAGEVPEVPRLWHIAAAETSLRQARRQSYDARAAAFDEIIAATLGNFSTWGDLRSHPALSHDSGTRNSE